MNLLKLTVSGFKNLHNVSISFDPNYTFTVVLGRNGAGKSNLIEAIISIFRNLDLGEPALFQFTIEYVCNSHFISIAANPKIDNSIVVNIDGKEFRWKKLPEPTKNMILPKHLFAYYSGTNTRIENYFDKHQKQFYHHLITEESEKLPDFVRRLFLARTIYSNFVLLAFMTDENPSSRQFLLNNLRIVSIESVLFVIKQPSWISRDGDSRFWNARGKVQEFLSRIFALSIAPLRIRKTVAIGFNSKKTLEFLFLFMKAKSLQKLAKMYHNDRSFFSALESTYISELISEIRIRVKIKNIDGTLSYRELSEGEQQLLMVLGLLKFTQEDESLFLLDEPDTHLNPFWSLKYLDFLSMFLETNNTSQIIMATHNPLVISGLDKSQIRIMERKTDTGLTTIEEPLESPKGKGVAGILLSDMFDLPSVLDTGTQSELDERRKIASKKEDLSEEEYLRLNELNKKLFSLDWSIRDPDYAKYINALKEHFISKDDAPDLPYEEFKRQTELAKKFLDEIMEDQK